MKERRNSPAKSPAGLSQEISGVGLTSVTGLRERLPEQAIGLLAGHVDELSRAKEFARSPGSIGLLRFLIDTEAAGSLHLLRETTIALGFYGRDESSYDPQLDAIVRVNANRLRHRLESFAHRNPDLPLLLLLPRGSYRLVVRVRPEQFGTEIVQAPVAEETPAYAPAESSAAIPAPGPSEVHTLPPSHPHSPFFWSALATLSALAAVLAVLLVRSLTHPFAAPAAVWIERPFSHAGGLEQFPTFTPDGKSVVFSWIRPHDHPAGLFVQALASDIPQPVPGSQPNDTRPVFSPDGKQLAFIRRQDGDEKQIVIHTLSDGREAIAATVHGVTPWLCQVPRLTWSADGKSLLTAATIATSDSATDEGADKRCNIVRVDLGTHAVIPLTHSPRNTVGDLEPAISPDGSQFAFVRNTSIGFGILYLQPFQASSPRALSMLPREIFGLTWNAKGDKLLYSVRDAGQTALRQVDVRSGQDVILSQGQARCGFPSVAPGDKRIAVANYSGTYPLYVRRDGHDEELFPDGNSKRTAVFSPDSKWLAFSSDRTGNSEVWLTNVSTAATTRLTYTPGGGAGRPQWFRDSKRMIYECRIRNHTQVCMLSIDAPNKVHNLTTADSDQVLPTLSHDEKSVLFSSNRSGIWEIYRQPIGGGRAVQITNGGGVFAEESSDGSHVYAQPGNAAVGLLVLPADRTNVPTAQPGTENNAFRRPDLGFLKTSAWTAAPGGILYADFAQDHSDLKLYDDRTRHAHAVAEIPHDRPVDTVRLVAGGGYVYSLRPETTAEIDMLSRP